MTRKQIFNAVVKERERQIAKWGNQTRPNGDWFLILSEEIGEVAECVVKTQVPPIEDDGTYHVEMHKELIQCAAVIFSWLEDKGDELVKTTTKIEQKGSGKHGVSHVDHSGNPHGQITKQVWFKTKERRDKYFTKVTEQNIGDYKKDFILTNK